MATHGEQRISNLMAERILLNYDEQLLLYPACATQNLSIMLLITVQHRHSTIYVYSFIYSLANRQELSVIDVLRQKCTLLRSTRLSTEVESSPKTARRVVRLSSIKTT